MLRRRRRCCSFFASIMIVANRPHNYFSFSRPPLATPTPLRIPQQGDESSCIFLTPGRRVGDESACVFLTPGSRAVMCGQVLTSFCFGHRSCVGPRVPHWRFGNECDIDTGPQGPGIKIFVGLLGPRTGGAVAAGKTKRLRACVARCGGLVTSHKALLRTQQSKPHLF